jgi:hypothetical protein
MRRGNEQDWLFDIVRRMTRALRRHPEERACEILAPNANARARVSKDEDERVDAPSCFETPRIAREGGCGGVILRGHEGKKGNQPARVGWAPRRAPCFRPVLYRGSYTTSACKPQNAPPSAMTGGKLNSPPRARRGCGCPRRRRTPSASPGSSWPTCAANLRLRSGRAP